MELAERVEKRVRDEICRVCIFRGPQGECLTPDPQGCGIIRSIDQAIQIVRETQSDRMDPYILKLREVVCKDCENQDQSGNCSLRPSADCSLDDYFGLLVEIIEDELKR